MPEIKVENLGEKPNPPMLLQPDETESVKGGAILEKLGNGKNDGSVLNGAIKGFGSTTGEGPSTF